VLWKALRLSHNTWKSLRDSHIPSAPAAAKLTPIQNQKGAFLTCLIPYPSGSSFDWKRLSLEKIFLVTRQPLLPTHLPHSLQDDRAVLFLMGRSVVDGKITFASIETFARPSRLTESGELECLAIESRGRAAAQSAIACVDQTISEIGGGALPQVNRFFYGRLILKCEFCSVQ
jgi:hypothetical protein